MPILTVDLAFTDAAGDQQKYTKLFDAQRDLSRAAWGFIAEPVLRACEAEILYGKYRQDLPDFPKFLQSAGANWFPSQHAFADLTRSAAHMNTAQAWWQIQNTGPISRSHARAVGFHRSGPRGYRPAPGGVLSVRDSKAGVGTELAVVQKYGKQDSGTAEYLPSGK